MKIIRNNKKTELDRYWGLNENAVIVYSSLCHFICKIQPFAQQWNQSSLSVWLMIKYSASHEASKIKGHSKISLTHNPLKSQHIYKKYAKIPLKPVSSFGGQV